jgi:hypothetical protein
MFNDIRLTHYIYMMFILWVITQNYVNLENFYVPWDSINIKDKVYKWLKFATKFNLNAC